MWLLELAGDTTSMGKGGLLICGIMKKASMRYISQRYTMPDRAVAGLLTDIGTEESAHLCCILYFQINFQIILIHVIEGIIVILYFTYKTF